MDEKKKLDWESFQTGNRPVFVVRPAGSGLDNAVIRKGLNGQILVLWRKREDAEAVAKEFEGDLVVTELWIVEFRHWLGSEAPRGNWELL